MTRRRSRRPMHERGEDIAGALAKAKRALLSQVPRSEPKKPVHDWWSANQARLAMSAHQQIAPTAPLVSTFQAVAAPRPGQRKVRPEQSMLRQWVDAAQDTMSSARAMFDEYETFVAWQGWALGGLRSEDGDPRPDDDWGFDDGVSSWLLHELVPTPSLLPDIGPLSPIDQDLIAAYALRLVGHERGVWLGEDQVPELGGHGSPDEGCLPEWASEACLADRFQGSEARMNLVPVAPDAAEAYIARHHSHLPVMNRRGLLYALGVRYGGRLVCVGAVNTPTGRWSQPERVVELTRVASDGTMRGSASMLVSRVIDALPMVAPRGATTAPPLLVTYSLTSEEGATYRALRDKGLRPVRAVGGRAPAGARSGSDVSLAQVEKVRWEAGPGAGSADWSLV